MIRLFIPIKRLEFVIHNLTSPIVQMLHWAGFVNSAKFVALITRPPPGVGFYTKSRTSMWNL